MNCKNVKSSSQHNKTFSGHYITMRLDESIPLSTNEWKRIEQLLMQMTEFAPQSLVTELLSLVAEHADDQAKRGYILGQEDLLQELDKHAA